LFSSPPRLQDETIDQSSSETTPLEWLEERLGLTDDQSMELAKRFRYIHALSIEAQLAPTLDFLQQRIGLSDDQLRELVRRQPFVLNASIQDHLAPNISWLDQERLQKVVLRLTPNLGGLKQLLGSNMEENFEPTLCWLQEKLNLGEDGSVQLVRKHLSFLGFRLESHKERVAWLQKNLALDDESLSKLVKMLPSVLGLSVDAFRGYKTWI
jgi:hypothetical protein